MTPLRARAFRSSVSLVAALAALTLASCGKDDPKANAPQALPVSTVKVATQKVPVSLESVGQAEGSREVEIRSRVSGILEKRIYEEGSPVTAGTVMFQVDPVPFELAVQEAKATLIQEKARSELADSDAKRLEPLAKEKAIAQRDYDTAVATAKTSEAAIAAAEAKLKEAELNLSYSTITAPISGITGRAQRSEGSLVTAGTDSALLTNLTQVNPIWVRFSLAEQDFNLMRGAERTAHVQIIGNDNAVLADNGKLNFLASTVDPRLGTVQLRAEFPNANLRWLPGQFARVRILAGEQNAILVPQASILQNDQSRIVMVVGPDGKAQSRPVKISNWLGSDAIITSGLKDGDQVITDNLVKVRVGTLVQPKS
ncbi:MAG TPA: efflux RND transporter periplasmic adaptor subunit [Usitatibacter sp.]|nr:efflux RND transporter periplasmic adaptor subunit [Usitatibacter sp.]